MCERLKSHTKAPIGPYQCGFRPGKSTIDQIFTLCQILKKRHENQDKILHLFVDIKAAFDSAVRDSFGILAKLIRYLQHDVEQLMPLRQGREGPLRTV